MCDFEWVLFYFSWSCKAVWYDSFGEWYYHMHLIRPSDQLLVMIIIEYLPSSSCLWDAIALVYMIISLGDSPVSPSYSFIVSQEIEVPQDLPWIRRREWVYLSHHIHAHSIRCLFKFLSPRESDWPLQLVSSDHHSKTMRSSHRLFSLMFISISIRNPVSISISIRISISNEFGMKRLIPSSGI